MSYDEINKFKKMIEDAASRTQTADKTVDNLDINMFGQFEEPTSKGSLSQQKQQKTQDVDKTDVNLRRASRQTTRDKTASITPTQQMIDQMSQLDTSQFDDEDDFIPEPDKRQEVTVTVANLPAQAQTALANVQGVNPEFHQVSALPGNMRSIIRQLGKGVFKEFTQTSTDDIHVVADLMGQGPNTEQEVNAVANWLKKNGQPVTGGRMDFSSIMPGYEANMGIYRAAGIDWMVIQDFAGRYIYTWPSHQTHITSKAKKMLGKE